MKKILVFCFICKMFCIFPATVFSQPIDDLILMTEEFPPYNFEADGYLQGTSIDLMCLILKKAGSTLSRDDIRLLP